MSRRVVVALVVALALFGTPASGAFAGDTAASAGGPATGEASPVADVGASDTREQHELTLDVQLRADGDARWTVTTYVELGDENDTAAFRQMRRRWEAGTLDTDIDAGLFRGYARAASNATGREMRVPDDTVERSGEIVANGTRGALRLSFTWTNFGQRDGDELVISDVFRTESGTWLDGLAPGHRLMLRSPPGFSPDSFPSGARLENGSRLIWEGPTTFEPTYFTDQPLVFAAAENPTPTPTVTPTPTPTTTTGTTPPENGPDRSMGLWLGIGAAVLLGGALALYRLLGDPRVPGGSEPASDGGSDGGGGSASATGNGQPADDAAAAGAAAAAAESESDPEPDPTPDDPFAGIDEELLSDEERVLRLLEANGGRMKQADIVKETGWSNAKVSQLLSSMHDDDEVDKLRIGRENLISLPDVDVGEVE